MRQKISLDKGWKFFKGDPALPPFNGHQDMYMASKTERGRGMAAKDYYDADWEEVHLPHDYVILEQYDETLQGSQGYLPRNNAWYRRSFVLDKTDEDKRISLIFEGVSTHATVWVNSHLVERNFCGYNAFEIDITDVLKAPGETNVISVKVDTSTHEGWWYEGGGIYRHVYMVKTAKVAVANWGTFVDAKKLENDWAVDTEVRLVNRNFGDDTVKLTNSLIDKNGAMVEELSETLSMDFQQEVTSKMTFQVDDPSLWSDVTPDLYKMITIVEIDGAEVDSYETSFGFRTIEFNPDKGFFLNGKSMKLKGVCGHFDHGGVGVGVPDTVWELRIKQLREMGCNSFRCGHTPPTSEFLNLCDQYGLMVMDESRWFETSDIALKQLENMIIKDRNHPSVIIWSVGNEEPIQSTKVGRNLTETLKGFVRSYDKSRPVTVALNGGFLDRQVSEASDIVGINYTASVYDEVHKQLPNHSIISPEVGATSNTRSIYVNDPDNAHYLAYDEIAAFFGSTHRKAWDEVVSRDFVAGMYIWTGYEYRGESTWPKLFAGGGCFDSSGYAKDNYHLMRSLWLDEPVMHVMPHWNLDVADGEIVKVMTYTNQDEVELLLNGKSLGRRDNDKVYQLAWEVPYEKGTLVAVGYADGIKVIEGQVETLEGPFHVSVDRTATGGKTEDQSVLVFDISIRDAKGRLATHLDDSMAFDLEGMTLLGTGNGDPGDHDYTLSTKRNIFKGLCQVIARVDSDVKEVKVAVKSATYGNDSIAVDVSEIRREVMLATGDREWKISQWWKSRIETEAIDLDKGINVHDVNTWEPVTLGENVFDSETGYRQYYASTKMPSYNDVDNTAHVKVIGIKGDVTFKIQHNPDYWPQPRPQEFLAVEKVFNESTGKTEAILPLKGFGHDEAVILRIVVRNDGGEVASVESVQWHI